MKNLLKTTIALTVVLSSFNTFASDNNQIDREIEATISAQPVHQVSTENVYKKVRMQLDEKLAQLQQAQDATTFNTLATESHDLALKARDLAPSEFMDLGEGRDNARQWSNIHYQQYRLGKIAKQLEAAATKTDLTAAKQAVKHLHV